MTTMIESSELEALRLSTPGPYRAGERVDCLWLVRNFGEETMSGAAVHVVTSEGLSVVKDSIEGAGFVITSEAVLGVDSPTQLEPLAPAESRWLRFTIEVGPVRVAHLGMRMQLESGALLCSETVMLDIRPEVSLEVEPPRTYCVKADPERVGMKIAIVNRGSVDESDARLTIPLPAGARIEKAHVDEHVSISSSAGRYEVRLPTLAARTRTEFGFLIHVGEDQRGDEFTLAGLRYESTSAGVIEVDPHVISLEPDVRLRATLEASAARAVPGEIVHYTMTINNEGRSEARNVRAEIALPDAVVYAAGTLSIGGVTDNRFDDVTTIRIERIAPRSRLVIKYAVTVRAPARAAKATVSALVNGREVEPVHTDLIAQPSFPSFANYVTTHEPMLLRIGDRRTIQVAVENRGAVSATSVRIMIGPTSLEVLGAIRVTDGRAESAIVEESRREDTGATTFKVPIGDLAPGARCSFTVTIAGTTSTVVDGSHERLNIRVVSNELESRLGTLAYEIDQADGLASEIEIDGSPSELRPSQDVTLIATVRNLAPRPRENVSVHLDLPEWFAVDAIEGHDTAGADGLLIRTLEAYAQRRLIIKGRVQHVSARRQPFTAGVTIRHRGDVIRAHAFPIDVVTEGDLSSSKLAITTTQGYLADVAIEVVNSGDGPVEQIMVRSSTGALYVANSTTIDGLRIGDVAGSSILDHGFAIPVIDSGRTVRVEFQIRLTAQAIYEGRVTITHDREAAQLVLEHPPFRLELRPQLAPRPIAEERSDDPAETNVDRVQRRSPLAFFKRRDRSVPTANDPSLIDPRITVVPDPVDEAEPVPEVEPVTIQPTIISDDEFVEAMLRKAAVSAPRAAGSPPLRLIDDSPRSGGPEVAASSAPASSPIVSVQSPETTPPAADPEPVHAEEPPDVRTSTAAAAPADNTAQLSPSTTDTASAPTNYPIDSRPSLDEPPAMPHALGLGITRLVENARPETSTPADLALPTLTGIVVADGPWVARAKAVFSRIDARPEMGWFRHAMALRVFAPTAFYGGSEALQAIWAPIASALESDLRVPLMRTIVPSWSPNDDWIRLLELDTYEAVDALQESLREALARPSESVCAVSHNLLYGAIGKDQLDYVHGQTGSLGVLDALLTDMIPTQSPSLHELSAALAAWRGPVSETFTTIALAGGRNHRMRTARKPSLDRLLDDVSAAVRRLGSDR